MRIKRIIFGLFFLVFSSALIFQALGLKTQGLNGDFSHPGKPDCTTTGFLSAQYQDAYSEYIRTNNPIYNELIRVNNQYRFTFFNALHNGGTIVGKNGTLIDYGRIKTVIGEDFMGKFAWDYYMAQFDFVSDTLQKLNKPMLYVIAGDKPHIYYNEIPDEYLKQQSDSTNYKWYLEKLKGDKRIGFIDMAGYYLKIKDTCKLDLYPKYSIHWSVYSVYLATDSIVKYTNKVLPQYEAGTPVLKGFEVTKEKKMLEYEMLDFLNMYYSYGKTTNHYPILNFKKKTQKKKPRVMVIGDSFGQMIADLGYLYETFDDSSIFIRYNAEYKYKGNIDHAINLNKLDFWKVFNQSDMVVFVSSELNLPNFTFGFTERAYDHFKGTKSFFTDYHTRNVIRSVEGDHYVYTLKKDSNHSAFLKNTNAPVEAGQKYEMTYWCKGKGELQMDFYPDYLPETVLYADSDEWKKYTWTFTMPDNTPNAVLFRIFSSGEKSLENDMQFKNFELKEVK